MRQRKIPMRKCLGCGEMKPKQELIRVVRAPSEHDEEGAVLKQGELSVDFVGKKSGRGAYLCRSMNCFNAAVKARRLERAFSCKIPDEIYSELEKEMSVIENEAP